MEQGSCGLIFSGFVEQTCLASWSKEALVAEYIPQGQAAVSLDTKPTIDNHEFKNPESGVDINNEPQLIPMNSALTKVPTARRKSS